MKKILPGSNSETFWPDGKLIGARRRSKIGKGKGGLSQTGCPDSLTTVDAIKYSFALIIR